MISIPLWRDASSGGAPIFVGHDFPLHPLAALLGDGDLHRPAAVISALCLFIALNGRSRLRAAAAAVLLLAALALIGRPDVSFLALGMASTWLMLTRFDQRPTRLRWIALVATLGVGFLGVTPPSVLLLLAVPFFRLLRFDRHRSRSGAIGIVVGAILALLIAAPWWGPSLALRSELAESGSGMSRRLSHLPAGIRNNGAPRFAFVNRFVVERSEEKSRQHLQTKPDFVVDHVPQRIEKLAGDAATRWKSELGPFKPAGGTLRIEEYRRGRVRLAVESSGWNLLATNRAWWTGWRVYWNEERLPPVVINNAYVGTFLPPGKGTLRFRYRPEAYDDGLRVMLFAIVMVVLYATYFPRISVASLHEISPGGASELPAARSRLDELALSASRVAVRLSLLLLLVYAVVLFANTIRDVDGPDSSGYLNQARLWTRGLIVPIDLAYELRMPAELAKVFAMVGFVRGPEPGTIVPSYPSGLPLHMVPFNLIAGERGAFYVPPLLALGAIIAMYCLGRELELGRGLSIAGAAILAAFPTFVLYAIQPMSDGAATLWAIVAMLFAFRSRNRRAWAIAAGAALGIGVLVRPTQILILPAILLAARARPRAIALIALGAFPFALFLLILNDHLYGSPLASGYGDIRVLLEWHHFPSHVAHYSSWLAALLTPLVFPIGLIALLGRTAETFTRASLAIWFAAIFLFYCFYGPYDAWWYTRFLLPAVPALILGLLLAAREIALPWRPSVRLIALALPLVIILATSVHYVRKKFILDSNEASARTVQSILDALKKLPERRLVVCNSLGGSVYYYTGEMTLRSEWIDRDDFEQLRAYAFLAERPIYALVDDYEAVDLFRRAPGTWITVAELRHLTLYRFVP